MKRTLAARLGILAPAVVSALALAGCLEDNLESAWPDREISIDGKASEWAGREAYYSEQEAFKIGFFNDADYLYVYLATWSRQKQMQILTNGLTLWLDAAGGKQRTFGIDYPMKRAMPDSGGTPPGASAGPHHGSPSGTPSDASGDRSRAFFRAILAEARGTLSVLGAGGEPIATLPAADDGKGGIAAMIDIANRTLIYEIRIPLAPRDSLHFAVNAAPGTTIGVGFKVGEMEMPSAKGAGQRPPGETPSGGGMGGPGAGMGAPGGGMGGPPEGGMGGPGGGGGMSAGTLEYWAKVRLAAPPSTAPPQ